MLSKNFCPELGVPTDCSIIDIVLFPLAILDCASEVISHTCHPLVGDTSKVERVISLVEQLGLLFQVTLSSLNVSQACALTVREDVPVTLCLYRLNNAPVGVIALGNGSSDRSNVKIIFDSPDPPDEIPRSKSPSSPKFVFGRLESIVASGTLGKAPVSSNTEPSYSVTVLLPAPSSNPTSLGTLKECTWDHFPSL